MKNRVRFGIGASLITVLSAVTLPVVATAQSTDRKPTVVSEGPSNIYNPLFAATKVTVQSREINRNGGSIITLDVSKLPDEVKNKKLGAHVHQAACGPDATSSGPHYANPQGDRNKPLEHREVWLDLSVDTTGRASSVAFVDWKIRAGEANSVVIHTLPTDAAGGAGPRILCTNIKLGTPPLQPNSDEKESFTYGAVGVQIYECRKAEPSGWVWAFVAPRADLLNATQQVVGSHGAGPFWQHNDGSRIVGTVVDRADAPTPGAIPLLLLRTTPTEGRGKFTSVTSIQRLKTVGGVAPTTGCSTAADAAKRAEVPYTADYVFWIKK
jgi:Cu/Zn superoxide dismutase